MEAYLVREKLKKLLLERYIENEKSLYGIG